MSTSASIRQNRNDDVNDDDNDCYRCRSLQLDRSIVKVLLHSSSKLSTTTASTKPDKQFDNTKQPHELFCLFMLHGTHLIQLAVTLLRCSDSVYATAAVMFHRYFFHVAVDNSSVTDNITECITMDGTLDIWALAMASTLLAIKLENGNNSTTKPIGIRQVILVFVYIYRRQALLLVDSDDIVSSKLCKDPNVAYPDWAQSLSLSSKRQYLRDTVILKQQQQLSKHGPVYYEWHTACVNMENCLLRRLGFTLYWIPTDLCHPLAAEFAKQLVSFLPTTDTEQRQLPNVPSSLSALDSRRLIALTWTYCNLSYRLNLCLRYPSEVVACAAVHLALLEILNQLVDDDNKNINSDKTHHPDSLKRTATKRFRQPTWWEIFCGPGHELDISDCCNAILYVRDPDNFLVQLANKAYLVHNTVQQSSTSSSSSPSTVPFNAPGSFVWEYILMNQT